MVTDTTEGRITVSWVNETRHYPLTTIEEIIRSPYDPSKPSPYLSAKELTGNPEPTTSGVSLKNDYPNLKLLPVSIIAFGLSWDYFKRASDLSSAGFENTRETVLGAVFIGAGIVNAIISFQSVEVKASANNLSLSYRF